LLGEGDAGTKREQEGDTQSLHLHGGSSYGDLRSGCSIDGSRSGNYTLLLRLHCDCDCGWRRIG
jgi:hypothetical protein